MLVLNAHLQVSDPRARYFNILSLSHSCIIKVNLNTLLSLSIRFYIVLFSFVVCYFFFVTTSGYLQVKEGIMEY